MEQFFTAGAQRALDAAAALACAHAADEVEPLHLLGALALEESRAAEILAEHGLTHEVLQEKLPELANGFPPAEGSTSPPYAEPPQLPRSERFHAVIFEAQRQAGLAGRHAEIGSEHLLLGLTRVESAAAETLARYGLTSETLDDLVAEKTGFSSEPLEIDFHIRWQDPAQSDHSDTYRILDAAANRAREGLRVVEDFVRFTLDDPHLTGLLKRFRHDLAGALGGFDASRLVAARDTAGDVGTAVTTSAEFQRTSPRDVARAGLKRVQEALRTLEEFGKIVASETAQQLEQLRYRFYTVEKAVLLTEANRRRLAGRDLYLLVTEAACHHGAGPAVREALATGVGIVQVREKSMPDGKLLEHARRVREWTRAAGALFVMNDRPDLAVLADADGVHVGQEELPVRDARRIVGPDRLVGVSTHTIEQVRQAVLDGADYLGVGPVFPSGTKHFETFAGLEFVRQAAEEIRLPWYAIGGITADRVPEVRAAGATRIAVSGAICNAERPGEAAAELLKRLRGAEGDQEAEE